MSKYINRRQKGVRGMDNVPGHLLQLDLDLKKRRNKEKKREKKRRIIQRKTTRRRVERRVSSTNTWSDGLRIRVSKCGERKREARRFIYERPVWFRRTQSGANGPDFPRGKWIQFKSCINIRAHVHACNTLYVLGFRMHQSSRTKEQSGIGNHPCTHSTKVEKKVLKSTVGVCCNKMNVHLVIPPWTITAYNKEAKETTKMPMVLAPINVKNLPEKRKAQREVASGEIAGASWSLALLQCWVKGNNGRTMNEPLTSWAFLQDVQGSKVTMARVVLQLHLTSLCSRQSRMQVAPVNLHMDYPCWTLVVWQRECW